MSYLWGIKWADKYTRGSNFYGGLLIVFTAINYVVALIINFYGYVVSSTEGEDCNNFPNVMSSIMLLALFGIQMLNYNKQNSLLATSALTLFNCYWLFSAIFSTQSCNVSLTISEGLYGTYSKSFFLRINIPISCLFVLLSSFGSIYGSSNAESESQNIELQ